MCPSLEPVIFVMILVNQPITLPQAEATLVGGGGCITSTLELCIPFKKLVRRATLFLCSLLRFCFNGFRNPHCHRFVAGTELTQQYERVFIGREHSRIVLRENGSNPVCRDSAQLYP